MPLVNNSKEKNPVIFIPNLLTYSVHIPNLPMRYKSVTVTS